MQHIPITYQLLNLDPIKSVRIYALLTIKTCWSNIDSLPIATTASLSGCAIPFFRAKSIPFSCNFSYSFNTELWETRLLTKLGMITKADSRGKQIRQKCSWRHTYHRLIRKNIPLGSFMDQSHTNKIALIQKQNSQFLQIVKILKIRCPIKDTSLSLSLSHTHTHTTHNLGHNLWWKIIVPNSESNKSWILNSVGCNSVVFDFIILWVALMSC